MRMLFKKTFLKNGKKIEVLFREPKLSDAPLLLKFINSLIEEKAYLGYQKKFKLKQEKVWLKIKIKELRTKNYVHIIALNNNAVVGSATVEKDKQAASHVGVFGIAIAKDYRGVGLGKFIMNLTIKQAKKQIKSEIIRLHVYSPNKPAIALYKKLGFKNVGTIPKGIKHHGKYMDDIIMYKKIK